MSKQDNFEISNQHSVIEDLAINQEQAEQVNGGAELQSFLAFPGFYGGVSVSGKSDGRDDIIVGATINTHVK
jgi:hypothetical protein